MENIKLYGLVYLLTFFPIKLYFSQKGKKIGKYTYQKISLFPLNDFYYYGTAKENENF